jgi:DNA-binding response OmpR family regulator
MKTKSKVLLVEDDQNLGDILNEYLMVKGYETSLARNGLEGFDLFKESDYDFCILDVMMPIQDGFTLAKEIRKVDKTVPIIFLTAKSMKEDKIEGFQIGADDYMTKPFTMEELLLRMKAIERRVNHGGLKKLNNTYEVGEIHFDYDKQLLTYGSEETQKLTSKENELLKMLCANVNDVLDRSDALKQVWGDDSYFNSRSMDVYITKLRKYLKPDENIEIVNVHGKGFKLMVHG